MPPIFLNNIDAILNRSPKPSMGLCLSGRGYRTIVFNIAVLWRLYKARPLLQLKHISSVSGGSIKASVLPLKWNRLSSDTARFDEEFVKEIVQSPYVNMSTQAYQGRIDSLIRTWV